MISVISIALKFCGELAAFVAFNDALPVEVYEEFSLLHLVEGGKSVAVINIEALLHELH